MTRSSLPSIRLSPSLLLGSFLALPLSPALAQGRLFPPTFQPGMEYTIRSQQSLESILGAGLPNAGKQTADVTFEVVAACRPHPDLPGHRDVSIHLTKVRMDVFMGGLKLAYDSTAPGSAETLLGQTFKNVVGRSFQITLNPEDQITAVQGLEEFQNQDSPLGQQVGVEQITQVAMPMLNLGVPKEGVMPGQTWEHVKDTAIGPAGNLKAAHQVTYEGDQDGAALLQFQARLDLDFQAPPAQEGAQTRVTIENGTLSGTMKVDKDLRFPTSGTGAANLTMTMPNPLDPAQNLQLPISQRRTFELIGTRKLD